MAQLCEPRRGRALLALLASLLLVGAEAADGEPDIHGENPGGSGEEWMAEAEGGALSAGSNLGYEGPRARFERESW